MNGPPQEPELRTSVNSVYKNQLQTIVPQAMISLTKLQEERNIYENWTTPTMSLLNQTPAWVNNPRNNSSTSHYT